MAAELLLCICLMWFGDSPVDESQCVGQPMQGQVCNVIVLKKLGSFVKKLQMNVFIEVYVF